MTLALAGAGPAEPAPSAARILEPQSSAQAAALRSIEPELAYSGRRFGGKSWTLCTKALTYALTYPGAHCGLCREERASMEGTTLRTLREEVVPNGVWDSWWKVQKSTLVLPNGSDIAVFGLDRPERQLGTRFGFVGVDQAEQLDRNQFEIINSSMMQPGMPWCQLALAFNPEGPSHWAYDRYQPDMGDGTRSDIKGDVFARVVHVTPDDLLQYLNGEARRRFDRLEGSWRDRLRLGLWVAFEGSVFTSWNGGTHIVEPPAEWARWGGYPPPNWSRSRGIDFGYDPDPFACAWRAVAPDGRRYIYRQIGGLRQTIVQWARELNRLDGEELATLRACAKEQDAETQREMAPYLEDFEIIGWSDHDRGERAQLEDEGIHTYKADKDIMAGIQTLIEALDPRDGGPRLMFVRGAAQLDPALVEARRPACFEQEIGRYRYRSLSETDLSSGKSRQLPVDRDNHWLDAVRYLEHSEARRSGVGVWI